jgi:hypothetical protein
VVIGSMFGADSIAGAYAQLFKRWQNDYFCSSNVWLCHPPRKDELL